VRHVRVDRARDLIDLRGVDHLLDERGLVAAVERPVTADAGHDLHLRIEAEKEERDAVADLQVTAAQRALEAVVAVDPLGLVQISLPEVGSQLRMVPLEPHPGEPVHEARAVAVPATNDDSHCSACSPHRRGPRRLERPSETCNLQHDLWAAGEVSGRFMMTARAEVE